MTGTIIGTLIAVVALAVVIYPFVRGRRLKPPAATRDDAFAARRDRIYRLIAELDRERLAGEVSEADFQAQVNELRAAAADVLREAEMALGGAALAKLEAEVQAARSARAPGSDGARS